MCPCALRMAICISRCCHAMGCVHVACMMLHMDYSLFYGHPGTRPCSSDHREAAGPVRLVVDRVFRPLCIVVTEQSPFAALAASSDVQRAIMCQRGNGTFGMIRWGPVSPSPHDNSLHTTTATAAPRRTGRGRHTTRHTPTATRAAPRPPAPLCALTSIAHSGKAFSGHA